MIVSKTSRCPDRPNPPWTWLMAVALAALSLSAEGAPGDIDTRFGDGGRVASGGSAIPLPNGGLAVGRNWVYGFEVEFLDAQGRPNPALGSGGRTVVTLPPTPRAYFGTHSLRMPDGGLVFAGWIPDGNSSGAKTVHALLRLTPRGDVDPAFGTAGNGIAQVGRTSVIVGLAPQADGRLLVALLDGTLEGDEMGVSCVSATYRISRLLRDGSVDPGYGVDGMLAVPDLVSADCLAPALFATDATGAAVIGDKLRLRRITPNGQVDMGFGWSAGVAVPPFKGEILGGVMTSTGVLLLHSEEAFGRLSPDGRVDPLFGGGDGVLPLWEDGGGIQLDRLGSIALTPDGRHVYVQAERSEDYMGDRICQVVLRMSFDGALDKDFGGNGTSCISFGRVSAAGRPRVLDNGQPVFELAENGVSHFYRLLVDSTPSGGALSLKVNFNSSVVDEADGSVTLRIARSAGKDGYASVGYTTLAGTAKPGSDYIESSGMLEWTPGDTSERTVTVKILQDSVVEGSETFSLELRGAEGAVVIGGSQAVTIAQASGGGATPPPVVTPPPPDDQSSGGGGAADGIVALLLFLAGIARARYGVTRAARSAPIAAALCLGMALAQADAHAAGSVDPTFGSSGVLRPQPASDYGLLMVAPLSGDRFLMLTCPLDYGCYGGLGLRRFARDGKLDTAFGESGVAFLDAQPSYPVIVMERADGALLLAGDEASRAGFLMAVTASGQPDPVFGGQSVLRFPQPVRALAVQADGKLLVATAPDYSECQSAGWTLQRLSASGVIDPTFGTAGATTSFAVEGAVLRNCGLTQIWEQPGGDIVIQTSAGLRRLRSDGSLDTAFGMASGLTPTKGTVTRTADGRFLSISGQFAAWSVRRYDVNGREDPSFGSGGVVDLYVAASFADLRSIDGLWINRIAALGDGARYVASMQIEGRLQSTGEWLSGTFIVRFLSDGRLDATFGKGGKVAMSRSGYLGDSGLFAQSDGKLVVAAGGAIYRLLSDNAPSPGFVIMGPAEPGPVVEGGLARIIVSRTGGADTAVGVSYRTVEYDAQAELDFIPVSGRLSWAAGDASDRIIEVRTVDDAASEPNDGYPESLVLRIAPAEGAPIITVDEQWIGIADNDPPPVVTSPPAIPPPPIVPHTLPSGGGGGGGAIGLVETIGLFGALVAGLRRRRVMLAVRRSEPWRHEGIRHGQSRTVLAQDRLHHLRTQLRGRGADRRPPHHEDPG